MHTHNSHADMPCNNAAHPLLIYDFCGTLFHDNTTFAFLKYACRGASRHMLKNQVLRLSAGLLRRTGLLAPAAHVRWRIRALHGFAQDELDRLTGLFLRKVLLPCTLRAEMTVFRDAFEQKRRLAIASYTLDILLNAFCQLYPVEYVCGSSLAFDRRGMCTGRFKLQLQIQGKLDALRQYYDEDTLRSAHYVTDDFAADADLCAFVAQCRNPLIGEETQA